jgi:hypothetical protein
MVQAYCNGYLSKSEIEKVLCAAKTHTSGGRERWRVTQAALKDFFSI